MQVVFAYVDPDGYTQPGMITDRFVRSTVNTYYRSESKRKKGLGSLLKPRQDYSNPS